MKIIRPEEPIEESGNGLESLDDEMARKTVKNYVCSNCWGDLSLAFAPERKWFVVCLHCGQENTKGYVTKYYANRRRQESYADRPEIMKLLVRAGILEDQPLTIDEAMRQLGF